MISSERQDQLIEKAFDLAEKQITNGTATSQVITHFLKLGTAKEELEKARLECESRLMSAKVEAIQNAERNAVMFNEVINAIKSYGMVNDGAEYDQEL